MKSNNNGKIPACIAVIIDGNRRWGRENGLTALEGHKAGLETLKKCISWAERVGVKNIIFYTFSTENWKRSKSEVASLMKLLETGLRDILSELKEKKSRVRFIGQKDRLPKPVQALIKKIEKETEIFTSRTVVFALSYGGRAEIIDAVNTLLKKGKKKITEETFEKELWTNGIPDPDIIIRTGNAMRLSNFLPWQSVYSELYFTDTMWPSFTEEEFNHVLDEYKNRDRRMGR